MEENRLDKNYYPKKERGEIFERFKLIYIDMTKGDWLILTRTNHLLKPIPALLKRQGLFFETAQGNSIDKSLYEDIQTWNELLQGLNPPDIKRQRLEELTGEENFNINLSWDSAFKNVAPTKREYMRAMLNNGEKILKKPRIKVSTIHGAKGGEATNVVLFLNQTINTKKGAKKSKSKQDEEYRVWYVGTTRSMKNLYLIRSNNKKKEFKI